jgi:hypothetical protein
VSKLPACHADGEVRDGLLTRGMAREPGIAAPAIYNYCPPLDDLITARIVDTFTALAEATEAAEVPTFSVPGCRIQLWPGTARTLQPRVSIRALRGSALPLT